MRTLPDTLLAKQGKLGSCSACPIVVFCQLHLQLAVGQLVMLHAALSCKSNTNTILNEFNGNCIFRQALTINYYKLSYLIVVFFKFMIIYQASKSKKGISRGSYRQEWVNGGSLSLKPELYSFKPSNPTDFAVKH